MSRTALLAEARYALDVAGYVVFRGVLSEAEVIACNTAIDANRADFFERKGGVRNSKRPQFAGDGTTGRFDCGKMLFWERPHCEIFRQLLAHPTIVPFLHTLLGDGFRLDHFPLAIIQPKGGEGFDFHGGAVSASGQTNHDIAYHVGPGGDIRCQLVNVAFALTNTEPGDGGFAVISGSHKANFPLPESIASLESATCSQLVTCPTLSPGDVVVFTEAVAHGALPWKAEHERRTLFYRFSPATTAYARGYCEPDGLARLQQLLPELTDVQRAILAPPYHVRMDRVTVGTNGQDGELEANVPQPRADDKKSFDYDVFGIKFF